MGGDIHLKLNIGERPIANKYREGKMKSTLERELNSMRNRWKQANQWVFARLCRSGDSCGSAAPLGLPAALPVSRLRGEVLVQGFGQPSDPTRLETRTKESNMCASARASNPSA